MEIWIDVAPANILVITKKKIPSDNELIWNLMNNGNMEFLIDLQMNPIQVEEFSVISANTRNLQFKCETFQMMLPFRIVSA
jgi:hypothetical protein